MSPAKRRVGRPTFVCYAPDLCAPCHDGHHESCGMDGEPDCLCKDHPIPVRVFRNDGSLR